ncbi:helix-turn-helix domain-containing protein [Gryllotalpicola reticulitermitis]|uniref:Helix-turn-helix domain-containing protein n=1 Tax=Gryllotalpicola reticulitermitis TaxID=1184153 RepID=A0ABV8QEA0_9MICO
MQPSDINQDPANVLFYTVPEAAQLLRVSYWTVNRMIQRRELASVKIGARRRIPRDAVLNLARSATQDGSPIGERRV